MNKVFTTALSTVGATILLAAQAPGRGQAPAGAPSPRPMIAETMPVVGDMTKAVHFYHDLLGLEPRAAADVRRSLEWYPTFPFLEDMYGGVGGELRNFIVLVPGSELQFEPIEWKQAKGKPLNPRLQDSGATLSIFRVSQIDKLVGFLRAGNAKVVTAGGKPVAVTDSNGPGRAIVFEDGNGFFVELHQPDVLPTPPQRPGVGPGNAPRLPWILGADTTVTVGDIEKSARFMHDVLGLEVTVDSAPHADPAHLDLYGMKGAQYREAKVKWPDGTPQLNLIQYTGIEQKALMPLVADPNATLMRMFVRDMAETLPKVKTFPDAKIMNVSGAPTTPEMRTDHTPWLVVRLPGGGTLLQIVGVANGRVG